jgi:hypothetical protein
MFPLTPLGKKPPAVVPEVAGVPGEPKAMASTCELVRE